MQPTKTSKIWVIVVTLAMVATAIAAIPGSNSGAPVGTRTNAVWYITGIVYSLTTQAPIAGMSIAITNTTFPINVPPTGSNGLFNITVDQPGNYTLTFAHEQYGSKDIYVIYDSTNVTTQLYYDMGTVLFNRLPKITGYVKDTRNVPVNGVAVFVSKTSTGAVLATKTTPSDGSYTVYVEATQVSLLFKKDGYYENSTMITLAPSKDYYVNATIEIITPTPTTKLFGEVWNSTAGKISGAKVSVSRDGLKWISNLTDSTGYYQMSVYSGRFKVKVTRQGYYDNESWADVPATDRHNLTIQMTQTAAEIYTLKGFVNETVGGANIQGALVTLHNLSANGKYENSTLTGSDGSFNISYFGATFRVSVSKDKFFTFTNMNITSADDFTATTKAITLDKVAQDRTISGRIRDSKDGFPLNNATITLYDSARIYSNYSTTAGSASPGYYTMLAYDGAFTALVEAPGYQAKLVNTTIAGADASVDVYLIASGMDTVTRGIRFVNWSTVQVIENKVLCVDNTSLRADADLKYGRGDFQLDVNNWVLSQAEIDAWKDFTRNQGVEKLYTDEFLTVDGFVYAQNTTTFSVTFEVATGWIGSADAPIYINTTVNYTLVDNATFELNATTHEVSLNVTQDTDYMNSSAWVKLPAGFEMTDNSTTPASVETLGWTNVSIDPKEGQDMANVAMTVKESFNGTAKARIVDGLYYLQNGTQENYTAIVRMNVSGDGVNTTVSFSAQESTDPVGNINYANFTWDFGDGSSGYGMKVDHNFNTSAVYAVKLNITETNPVNYTNPPLSLNIKVDSIVPVAAITPVNTTLVGGFLYTSEDKDITLNGSTSYDFTSGTEAGVIQTWYWSWGDNSTNQTVTKGGDNNITHKYDTPGNYTVMLNVTDVVGHKSADMTLKVIVNDTTAPEPLFKILNDTWAQVTSGRENFTYYFNGSDTTDNYYALNQLTFTWSFGDGTDNVTGVGRYNVSHAFANVLTAQISLMVSDPAGNVKWYNDTQFSVGIGVRPNIVVDIPSIAFSNRYPKVGESVTISANFTNKGDKDATGFSPLFSIKNADGTETAMEGTPMVYDDAGNAISSGTVLANQTVAVKMTWTPKDRGNYSILINATCPDEHSSQFWDNSNANYIADSWVNVQQADWINIAIVGSVILVIVLVIVVVVILYRRKQGSGDEDEDEERRKKK
ncbi:MAG: carboxypeptidase regulatory-like domain-containing protein [Euryarchaeota archaeon]|nr:carboxypeptidase regulatory-like domain-containing protein [Euryarchaeota archaeon]